MKLIPNRVDILDSVLDILHDIVNLKNKIYYDSMMVYAWRVFNKAFEVWDKNMIKKEFEVIMEPMFRDINGKLLFWKCGDICIVNKSNISSEIAIGIRIIAGKIGPNILKTSFTDAFGDKYSKEIDEILKKSWIIYNIYTFIALLDI